VSGYELHLARCDFGEEVGDRVRRWLRSIGDGRMVEIDDRVGNLSVRRAGADRNRSSGGDTRDPTRRRLVCNRMLTGKRVG
jgi:hypothetical protein